MATTPAASSTPAARMRNHRKRRSRGFRCVPVQLHVTDIDALISKKYLEENDRDDVQAIQAAAEAFISDTLGGFE